jgi:MFS family permease
MTEEQQRPITDSTRLFRRLQPSSMYCLMSAGISAPITWQRTFLDLIIHGWRRVNVGSVQPCSPYLESCTPTSTTRYLSNIRTCLVRADSLQYTYLTFTLLFELGSLVCGLATSSSMFIGGRVIAGLGAAGLTNGAFTVISSSVPLDKSPMYTGILAGFTQLGIIAGPLIGGVLTEHVRWQWCFLLNLPVGGAAAALLVFVRIPEIVVKERMTVSLVKKVVPELDLIGFALFVPAAVMFLMALQFGSGDAYAWNSATIIGLLCGAGVTALLFVTCELKMGDRAMIPGSMLRKRIVWTSCVFGSALMCCSVVASNWLPTYFQAVKGEEPTLSGVHILPSILSALLFVVVVGALSKYRDL